MREIFITDISPLRHILELSERWIFECWPFFFVRSGWGSPLFCFCADINTTYSMGTAAFYAADFTAVGAAITLRVGVYAAQIFAGVGVMLPILLLLVLLLHYG